MGPRSQARCKSASIVDVRPSRIKRSSRPSFAVFVRRAAPFPDITVAKAMKVWIEIHVAFPKNPRDTNFRGMLRRENGQWTYHLLVRVVVPGVYFLLIPSGIGGIQIFLTRDRQVSLT
jgi:hypothetical protein